MENFKINKIESHLTNNTYNGRGIIIGRTKTDKAVIAYFIMGRSENSRNRIFKANSEKGITIFPFDEAKVEDPSLIIYSPIRSFGNNFIVTNGDQTDTIFDYLEKGDTFVNALKTREYEPDSPNFTPRISGILEFGNNDFSYEMSILKSSLENGGSCQRNTFSYESIGGMGHFIHTYQEDGNPLPSFLGEPRRIEIPDNIEIFVNDIWDNLNTENKISLCVEYIDIKTNEVKMKIVNKHLQN